GDVRGQVPEVAVLEVQDHQATASRVTAHRRVRSNGLLESMISFTTNWYFSSESFSGASVTRAWSATRKSTPCASSMGMEMSTVCRSEERRVGEGGSPCGWPRVGIRAM